MTVERPHNESGYARTPSRGDLKGWGVYPLSVLGRSTVTGVIAPFGGPVQGPLSLPISERQRFLSTVAAQYGRRLRRFLSVRLRNVHDVPDLAQEVFLRLLRVERHETIRNPEAYLFTVASHVIHQHTLRRSSEPISVDITEALAELQTSESEDPTSRAESAQRVEAFE